MNDRPLFLSLFRGIGLLDSGFQAAWPEASVVCGPDVIWGSDARDFHVPAGVFDGCFGGPPCQLFSRLRYLSPSAGQKHGNMIPEFERIVAESRAAWFLMENVPEAPAPRIQGYWPPQELILNNRWLGEIQERTRRFSFGMRCDLAPVNLDISPDLVSFENPVYRPAVTSSLRDVSDRMGENGRPKRTYRADGTRNGPDTGKRAALSEMCELQGLPPNYLDEMPFTMAGKRQLIANGVPYRMAFALARAVRRALEQS